jgi:transcriptional regulator with XRE-family HTH domain
MPDRRTEFGKRVRAARERAGYKKPDELADAAQISRRMAFAVELGEHAGPKTLRAVARTLGWRETDVIGYIDETLTELPDPELPEPVATGDLAPLDEVLTSTFDELVKLARLYAWYEGRRQGRGSDPADQKRFMRWALDVQEREGGIQPSGPDDGDGT